MNLGPGVGVQVDRLGEELSETPGQVVFLAEQKGQGVIPADNFDRRSRMLDAHAGLPEARVAVCDGMDFEVAGIDLDISLEAGKHRPHELDATAARAWLRLSPESQCVPRRW